MLKKRGGWQRRGKASNRAGLVSVWPSTPSHVPRNTTVNFLNIQTDPLPASSEAKSEVHQGSSARVRLDLRASTDVRRLRCVELPLLRSNKYFSRSASATPMARRRRLSLGLIASLDMLDCGVTRCTAYTGDRRRRGERCAVGENPESEDRTRPR